MDYKKASKYFEENRIRELSLSPEGLRYLKIRSLSRKKYMEYLIKKHDINVRELMSKDWGRIIFESDISTHNIDETISHLYKIERTQRKENEEHLLNELYKIHSFDWGGLYQNNLEKTIIDNYVKKIISYDDLGNAIENELHKSMRSYVLASWYNHWSSIIIEDVFKDHSEVIPSIGLIKKIDFFINNKPFDLKVTYFPEGYIKAMRKKDNLKPELTLMKQLCRKLNIGYEQKMPESSLIPDIWKKLGDHPDQNAQKMILGLKKYREYILNEAVKSPTSLITWLYENQGMRRFDASNRLFLILVDKGDFFNSWQLKRAKPLIQAKVNNYLDNVNRVGLELNFKWEDREYMAISDILFVIK